MLLGDEAWVISPARVPDHSALRVDPNLVPVNVQLICFGEIAPESPVLTNHDVIGVVKVVRVGRHGTAKGLVRVAIAPDRVLPVTTLP